MLYEYVSGDGIHDSGRLHGRMSVSGETFKQNQHKTQWRRANHVEINRDKWVPVITAWPRNVVGSCEYIKQSLSDSRHGFFVQIWGLGEVLISSHPKKLPCYEPTNKASDLYPLLRLTPWDLVQERDRCAGCCECGNEHSGSVKCGEFLE